MFKSQVGTHGTSIPRKESIICQLLIMLSNSPKPAIQFISPLAVFTSKTPQQSLPKSQLQVWIQNTLPPTPPQYSTQLSLPSPQTLLRMRTNNVRIPLCMTLRRSRWCLISLNIQINAMIKHSLEFLACPVFLHIEIFTTLSLFFPTFISPKSPSYQKGKGKKLGGIFTCSKAALTCTAVISPCLTFDLIKRNHSPSIRGRSMSFVLAASMALQKPEYLRVLIT